MSQDNLTRFARGQTRTLRLPGICTYDPETTVPVHINRRNLGGMGMKCSSLAVVHGCAACHAAIGDHGYGYESEVLDALCETLARVGREFDVRRA